MSLPPAPPALRWIRCFAPGLREEPAGRELLGGKGFSLALMSRAGLNVPPGFTILVELCRRYHAAGRRWPAELDAELDRALAWLEAATGRSFHHQGTKTPRTPEISSPDFRPMGPLVPWCLGGESLREPLLVAVRSGAAASMPGMLETRLNVGRGAPPDSTAPETTRAPGRPPGAPEEFNPGFSPGDPGVPPGVPVVNSSPREELAAAIRAVWDSWTNERAVRYRRRHGLDETAGTAVTVQAMFPAEASGVLFTEDPRRPGAGRLVVEATRGLGEALVRGAVVPEAYVLRRAPALAVLERPPAPAGAAPLLDEAQLLELARLGLAVEELLGAPADIEWGFLRGEFALLQARPIAGIAGGADIPVGHSDRQAGMPAPPEEAAALAEERARLARRAAGRKRVAWVEHNLGETLVAPTPLSWEIVGGWLAGGEGFVGLYRDLGFAPSARVAREGFLELVAGRVYADLGLAAELFWGRSPMEYEADGAGGAGAAEALLGPPCRFNYERAGLGFILSLPWYLWVALRAARRLKRAARTAADEFAGQTLPDFLAYVRRERARDLAVLDEAALLAELRSRERRALGEFGRATLRLGFLAGYFHGRVVATLTRIFGPAEGGELAARLLGGLEGDKTVELNQALRRLARGELAEAAFLDEFGHRALGELELAEPRWREEFSYPRRLVEELRRAPADGSPLELHRRRQAERAAAEAELSACLAASGASALEADLRRDLDGARRYLPFRETGKHYLALGLELLRQVLEELARRWALGRDLYFLRCAELAGFPARAAELGPELARRRTRWAALRRLSVPTVLRSTELEALGRPEEPPAADAAERSLAGTGISGGLGAGTARIVRAPDEAADLGAGCVLVCPSTDPAWTPLFLQARALVLERGGLLSHGAIVARELGLPAVVLPGATRLIPDGAPVRVDGTAGIVTLTGPAAPAGLPDGRA